MSDTLSQDEANAAVAKALRADLAEVNRAIISCGGGPALRALLSEKLSIVRQLRILEE